MAKRTTKRSTTARKRSSARTSKTKRTRKTSTSRASKKKKTTSKRKTKGRKKSVAKTTRKKTVRKARTPVRKKRRPVRPAKKGPEQTPEAEPEPVELPVPSDRTYTPNHEWVKLDAAVVRMGITEPMLERLGKLVSVELPDPDDETMLGVAFGSIEGENGVHAMFPPADASVLDVNETLEWDLDALSEDPYDKGWLIKIKVHQPDQLRSLMIASAYADHCQNEWPEEKKKKKK